MIGNQGATSAARRGPREIHYAMTSIRLKLGLTVAAVCGIALAALACAAPPTSLSRDDDATAKKGKNGEEVTTTGLPCDVSEILVKNCQTCHGTTPKTGASVPLVTYEDLTKKFDGERVLDRVQTRIHDKAKPMPPAAKLTDDQLDAIDRWIEGGAERSSASCETGKAPPATQPFECPSPGKVTTLKSPTPFKWTDDSKADRYVCFGVDEKAASKRHAIMMGPMVENLGIVHHVLLFQAPESEPAEPRECEPIAAGSWKMVTGWAPGGGNFELPPEAGFPVEGSTHWVVQVHYNNARGLANQTDNSGYQLCETDELRPNDAGILAFGSMDFAIPPRSNFEVTCDYKLDEKYQGVTFFGASPHMHTQGVSIGTTRIPGGSGTPEVIFEQKPFRFENQENFKLDHKRVAPGDVMRTTCAWKNTTEQTIRFGENTADEMCFNFLAYYPAIPDMTFGPIPIQTWASPSLSLPLIGGPECTSR